MVVANEGEKGAFESRQFEGLYYLTVVHQD